MVTHYPEAGAQSPCRLLQRRCMAFAADQVLVTNGVTEAIYLTAQAFRQRCNIGYGADPNLCRI